MPLSSALQASVSPPPTAMLLNHPLSFPFLPYKPISPSTQCLAKTECSAAAEEAEALPLALQLRLWKSDPWPSLWLWKIHMSLKHNFS